MIAWGVWLVALWHRWSDLPQWIRRLIGGFFVLVILVGAAWLGYHRVTSSAYARGKRDGVDSVQVAILKRAQTQHDSTVAHDDSLNRASAAAAQHEIVHARATADSLEAVPHAVPVLPVSIDSSRWSTLRLELAQTLTTKDSLLYQVAVPEIRTLADSADHLLAALSREHVDRLQADSLAHAWEARALAPRDGTTVQSSNRLEEAAKLAAWTALVWTIARHVRF
jgi:hypothetical protein